VADTIYRKQIRKPNASDVHEAGLVLRLLGWILLGLQRDFVPGRSASIGLPARKGIGDLEQPNPGRGAAPGQHVSHPDGPKRPGVELN
jgi:hypothetical protein